jgi:hypothetical protein
MTDAYMLLFLRLVVHIMSLYLPFMPPTLMGAYQAPTLESFCNYFIREKHNLLQLGVINTVGTSNKYLVSQHKYKNKHPNK